MGRVNSSIGTLFARKPFFEAADFAVEPLLGFRAQATILQLLLSLGDFNVTFEVRIFVLHVFGSLRVESMCLRMMSVRFGRFSPPVSLTASVA